MAESCSLIRSQKGVSYTIDKWREGYHVSLGAVLRDQTFRSNMIPNKNLLLRLAFAKEKTKGLRSDIVRKMPLARYLIFNLTSLGTSRKNVTIFDFAKSLLKDKNSDLTSPYYSDMKELQINRNNTIVKDRYEETACFFEKKPIDMLLYFIRNGTPNTTYFRMKLEDYFTDNTAPNQLFAAYQKSDFHYANRLMLRYHNYSIGFKVIDALKRIHPKSEMVSSEFKILDYGCGVADPSLILSKKGFDVTISDLNTPKFALARWRFDQRELRYRALPIENTEAPPVLQENFYDAVILAQLLEHTRNPSFFLKHFANSLRKGGILYDSLGPTHKHGVGGDHLIEARLIVDDPSYSEQFNKMFLPLSKVVSRDIYNHLYLKR